MHAIQKTYKETGYTFTLTYTEVLIEVLDLDEKELYNRLENGETIETPFATYAMEVITKGS